MAGPRRWLSTESEEKLNKAIELYVSRWSELNNALDVYRRLRKAKFSSHVFDFFTSTSDPNVDSLAEEIHRVIRNTLDGLVDLNDCKKAAQQTLKIHQSFLDESGGKSVARHEIVSLA